MNEEQNERGSEIFEGFLRPIPVHAIMNPTEPVAARTDAPRFSSLGPYEEVRCDQRRRWRTGQRVFVESYLRKDSRLASDTEGVLDLIYQEMLLREEAGETPSTEEYQQRFPDLATELEHLHQVHRAIDSVACAPSRIGETISHYRLERRLGAGGMGEVYLARDIALGRLAALKLLPSGYSASLRSRLLVEAEASARLQHPAIATFFESGTAAGEAFIAMEYVEGETLRKRLRSGPLPWQDTLAVITCVLEGLAHAHAAGVLHRDIKPENIMLTSNRTAKLLDFGLAKHLLVATDGPKTSGTWLTTGGQLVGTAGYMSPEQLRGEALDPRCDVFVVGAVLYEALFGKPAFPGKTPAERMAAILNNELPQSDGADIPKYLGVILDRSLHRDLSSRYGSAADFLTDLRNVGSDAISHFPDTVAVIDFSNRSGNSEVTWIGSGFAESLSEKLSTLRDLRVLPRETVVDAIRASSDSTVVEKKTQPLGQAGSPTCDQDRTADQALGVLLGCRWIASGEFEKGDNELRITARLVEVATAQVKASVDLAGPLESIFQMQGHLATSVATWLNQVLDADNRKSTLEPTEPNLDAYECYARGRRLWHRLEKGTFQQAQRCYEQAIRYDPAHAPSLCGLAGLHALLFTFSTDEEHLEVASQYAERAIAADPTMLEARTWLAYVRWRQERLDDALREIKLAMPAGPNGQITTYFAPYFAGCILLSMRRFREALAQYQIATNLNPQDGWSWFGLGWTHLELGNQSVAIWCLKRASSLEHRAGQSPTAGIEGVLGEVLRRTGELEDARRFCMQGLDAVERTDHMYRDTLRGICLCSLGRTALDQGNLEAASAAFNQAIAHIRGRSSALGGGHLIAQAMAGLAQVHRDVALLTSARQLFSSRGQFSFHYFAACSDDVTLAAINQAADAIDQANNC